MEAAHTAVADPRSGAIWTFSENGEVTSDGLRARHSLAEGAGTVLTARYQGSPAKF
jgi:hypothetical protein